MKYLKPSTSALGSALAFLIMMAPLSSVVAALQGENILSPIPPDFIVGSRSAKGPMVMSEYVPIGETVDAWSKMITVQVIQSMPHYDPDLFATEMSTKWKTACPGGDAQKIRSETENGYAVSLWMFLCPLNPQTQKPENMWLKAIGGQDALYDVQYAYRKDLEKSLIPPAMHYLRGVSVCDVRDANHPCPKGMQ